MQTSVSPVPSQMVMEVKKINNGLQKQERHKVTTLGKPEGLNYPCEVTEAESCQPLTFRTMHDLGHGWTAVTEGVLIERSASSILRSPHRQPRDRGCLLCRTPLHAPVAGPQWTEQTRPSTQLPTQPREGATAKHFFWGICHFHQ